MKVEQSIEIDQPPSVVYEFMMDPENLSLWITNFVRMEHISGEEGEVGAVARHFYDEKGRVMEMTEEILELKENEKFRARYLNNYFSMELDYLLRSARENQTTVRVESDVELKSWLFRLFAPMVKKRLEKRLGNDLERLKDAIEELTEIEGD